MTARVAPRRADARLRRELQERRSGAARGGDDCGCAVSWFARRDIAAAPLMIATRLWPAYALAAPWLLLRLTHVLPTDIAGGSPSRV